MTARELVRAEQTRLAGHITAVHAGWGAAFLAGALAVMVMALGDGRWLDLHPAVPLGLWSVVAIAVLAGTWWTIHALREAASAAAAARTLERDRRLRHGSVVGAAELDERDPFVHRAAAAIRATIASSTADPGVLAGRRSRLIRAGVASLTGVALLGGASSVTPDGWRVVNHPLAAANGDMLSPLKLAGAPQSILRGSPLSIPVEAKDRRWIRVHHRTAGQAWTTRTVRVVSGKGVASLGRAMAPIWVYASDSRGSTDTVLIGVTDRPYLGDVGIQAVYPAYLRRQPEPVEPAGTIVVPRGTILVLRGRASVPLSAVSLAAGGRVVRLGVDGYAFAGSLMPASSGAWSWRATGHGLPLSDLPPAIRVELEPDRAPVAEIVSPSKDTVISMAASPQVLVSATDDHGLSTVSLGYWKQSRQGPRSTSVVKASAGNLPVWRALVPITIPLAPGDEIHFMVTAIDASPWRQPGVSSERIIRIASRADERETARYLADSAVAAAVAAAAAQGRLEQQTSAEARARADRERSAAQSGGSSPRADRVRAVATDQRSLANRVEQLRATADALESGLRAANALDAELAARLQEVRQLLRTALTPALLRSIEELERLQRDPAASGVQDALRDLAAQQRRMREQLERVVQMLRRAAVEGTLQTLADDARELAAAEASPGADSVAGLRRRSRRIVESIEAVQNQLRGQQARAGQMRTGNALSAARVSTRAIEESPADFRTASAAMSGAAEQLAAARSEQIREWKSELTSDLDVAVQELIQLAREQQALASRVESGARASWRPDQSSLQQGAAAASERVTRAARRSTLISPRSQTAVAAAAQKVARVSAAQIPGGSETAALMRDAAGALNQAAATLIRDRERTASARSASGFAELLEELQRLAREQGALNSEAGALALQMRGGAPSGDRVRALARRQRSIASRLEDVAGSAEGGRASALADEARRIAERLEAAGIDENALARQQQLYRRLLDAGRTLSQDDRDSTAGRRSERVTSTAVFSPSPGDVDGRRGFREPSWAELRGLTAEERQLVIDYFRRINARR